MIRLITFELLLIILATQFWLLLIDYFVVPNLNNHPTKFVIIRFIVKVAKSILFNLLFR
jgi:hypothetical protein